jgi:uncharacterized protein
VGRAAQANAGWRRALVTGASSGIGEAFADRLASAGTDLILVGRDVTALGKVADRARGRGVAVDTVALDLSVDENIAALHAVIDEATPAFDLLVNNAGAGQFGAFVDLPLEDALEVMRVNNDALVSLSHAEAQRMLTTGRGSIIQISSMASASPGPGQAVYAAAKAFVTSFGQAISAELATTGATCTTVLPGYARTRYFSRAGVAPAIPDHHWMTSDEVAGIALDAALRGRPLVIPGRRNRWKLALATPFPTLAKGRARRWLGQLQCWASFLGEIRPGRRHGKHME